MADIKFIKIKNMGEGSFFLGEPPFVHWFDGPKSINIWHDHTIIAAIEDKHIVDNKIRVKVPTNKIFHLYKHPTNELDLIDIDSYKYIDLQDCLVDEMEIESDVKITRGDKTYQLFPIQLVCYFEDDGEYIEKFYIKIHDHCPWIPYNIGVRLYGENETLPINLCNKGVEIPISVIKSIYQSDLTEDNTDWILMNRKWRELLTFYMEILGGRGNYNTLQNALKWFEYGDLVQLRDCWKHHTEDGVKYSDIAPSKFIADWLKESMDTRTKSTYIYLRHLTNDFDAKPKYIYNKECIRKSPEFMVPEYPSVTYDGESDGLGTREEWELEQGVCRWSKNEMKMKMSLLGNFFATYFAPIHLDIMRSVVEETYFAAPLLIQTYASNETEQFECKNAASFDIAFDVDKVPDPDSADGYSYKWLSDDFIEGPIHTLDEVTCWRWSPYKFPWMGHDCVVLDEVPANNNPSTQAVIDSRKFEGTGCIIKILIKTPERVRGKIYTDINREDEIITLTQPTPVGDYYILTETTENDDGSFKKNKNGIVTEDKFYHVAKLNILCQRIGKFSMIFDLEGDLTGATYVKRVEFEVNDGSDVRLKCYKLSYDPSLVSKNPFEGTNLGLKINDFYKEIQPGVDCCIDSRSQDVVLTDDGCYRADSPFKYFCGVQSNIIYKNNDIRALPTDIPRSVNVYSIIFDSLKTVGNLSSKLPGSPGGSIKNLENYINEKYTGTYIYLGSSSPRSTYMFRNISGSNVYYAIYIDTIGTVDEDHDVIKMLKGVIAPDETNDIKRGSFYIPQFHKYMSITEDLVSNLNPIYCIPVVQYGKDKVTKLWEPQDLNHQWKRMSWRTCKAENINNKVLPINTLLDKPVGYYEFNLTYYTGGSKHSISVTTPNITSMSANLVANRPGISLADTHILNTVPIIIY